MGGALRIVKVLNNNACVCIDASGRESIAVGRGLGFKRRAGIEIDAEAAEKIFSLDSRETGTRFQQIVSTIPVEHILLAEEIISRFQKEHDLRLHESIYVTLSDHISAAIERHEQCAVLKNPLRAIIKRLYPREYDLALAALPVIRNKTGIDFDEDEAAFIAIHFVNAEIGREADEFEKTLELADAMADVARRHLRDEVQEDSISWQRFMTHCTFFAQRMQTSGEPDSAKEEAPLFSLIEQLYPRALACAQEIAAYCLAHTGFEVDRAEQTYLTLHIYRLQQEFGIGPENGN